MRFWWWNPDRSSNAEHTDHCMHSTGGILICTPNSTGWNRIFFAIPTKISSRMPMHILQPAKVEVGLGRFEEKTAFRCFILWPQKPCGALHQIAESLLPRCLRAD